MLHFSAFCNWFLQYLKTMETILQHATQHSILFLSYVQQL